jgi:hypothetical protein
MPEGAQMIEITDGFTGISAGADSIDAVEQACAPPAGVARAPRRPTGARVTVEFGRTSSLLPTEAVSVRYDFAADGNVRQLTGIPIPIRTVVRHGREVRYYYRLSYWIAASALMDYWGEARRRTVAHHEYAEPKLRSESGGGPMLKLVAEATANDLFPA